MKSLTALPLALATAFAMTAIAQTPPASAPATNNNPQANQPATNPKNNATAAQNFGRADSNHDGKVSRDELTKYGDSTMNFGDLDQDGDGNLTNAEWNRHGMKPIDDEMDDDE